MAKLMLQNKNVKRAGVLSYIALFFIWGLLEMIIVPFVGKMFSMPSIELMKEVILKITIWLIPAILLCRHYDKFLNIKKEKIFSTKIKWSKVILVLLLFTMYHVISAYVQDGNISISSSFRMTDILIASAVGISEEMVFRGWLLNIFLQDKKWVSISVNAVLFLVIHFPVWIQQDMFSAYIMSGGFLQIIILSMIFSYAFIKSKNILVPSVLHAYWDFLCFVL